nr:GLUG motif-containing protein [Aliarcobacter faecis]
MITTTTLFAAPSGGNVVNGTATINQSGNTTNINQSTQKATINWQKFDISKNETVNFNQPNSSSVTLNRVVGATKSIIDGAMNANGQVILVNPNGVVFNQGSQINVGGLIATTKNISNSDFENDNYVFSGNSTNSIINKGEINASYVVLLGNEVVNEGVIQVNLGRVELSSGDKITLNLNGNSLVNLTIDEGTFNALVENKGVIKADGGKVYLTTKAVNSVLDGMVNNSGVIEAKTLSVNEKGEVILFAHGGTANIDGEIIADGSFVETSGDVVNIADSFKIKADKYLIDPADFTIASSGGNMTGTAVSNALVNTATFIIESTNGTSGGNGNVYVNDNITWSSGNRLYLVADNNIYINATIDASSGAGGKLGLHYGRDTNNTDANYYFGANGKVKLQELTDVPNANFATKKGNDTQKNYAVINTDSTLQSYMNANLGGNIALGDDITLADVALGSSNWTPIEDFNGNFDGLGHTISNLTIDNEYAYYQGFFAWTGSSSLIKNIGLINVNVKGYRSVGGLIGYGEGVIENSHVTGNVVGHYRVGGLVGYSEVIIKNSYATGNINGSEYVGGLVGYTNNGNIENSHASGNINGSGDSIGGLVGYAKYGNIENSYASGNINGSGNNIGGLVGYAEYGNIENSYATGNVTANDKVGGLVGYSNENVIENSYATGNVTGNDEVGGLVGELSNYDGQTKDNYATGNVTGNSSVGGLIGYAEYGDIENSYATGDVEGSIQVGGLVGVSKVEIKNSYASGDVTGNISIGGLIGYAEGDIENSYATGTVTGSDHNTGGLVGNIFGGTISNSYATGTVIGSEKIGGFIGLNVFGNIENSYATGTVYGDDQNIGGFIGFNNGNIKNSYATGTVTGSEYVGGFVGLHVSGSIVTSYSTGNVTGNNQTGGLVGGSAGTISNSYASGDVQGNGINTGGLVGGSMGIIENSYASGEVSGAENVGGLVGMNNNNFDATITNSFYDKTKNPDLTEDSNNVGKTTTELQDIDTFSAWDIIGDNNMALDYPILSWQENRNDYVWVIGTNPNTENPENPNTENPENPNPENPENPNNSEQVANNRLNNLVASIINGITITNSVSNANTNSNFTNNIFVNNSLNKNSLSSSGLNSFNTQLNSAIRNTNSNLDSNVSKDTKLTLVGQTGAETPLSSVDLATLMTSNSLSEVRVALSPDSFVQLVNGGVSLPNGVSQELYVVEDKK